MVMRHDEAMTVTVRALQADDADVARRLGEEAFGVPVTPPGEPASIDQAGFHWYGSFAGGVLAARMIDREFDSYFGGAAVPTCGIAGVTVAAEFRSRGLLSALFTETLGAAKERGAAVSTLFPTAPAIYRRFGYELISSFDTVQVPTHVLASVPASGAVEVRRAHPADLDAIRTIYDVWAQEQNGPLSRRGISFDDSAADLLDRPDGVSVAVDPAGTVSGFARWSRGQGYGDEASLTVVDLLATSADGYRGLLRTLGSFSSVTARTRIDTSGNDLVRLFVPSAHWEIMHAAPYMLKVLDVCAALDRPCLPGLTADLTFMLAGDFLAGNNGGYVLELANGRTGCSRASTVEAQQPRTFTPAGLAQMYAGAQSSANLRVAGHLSGGDPNQDLVWDAVFGGRQTHIRNFF